MDPDLFEGLYLIFVDLITWCRREGKTELNAVRASCAALRSLGVDDHTVSNIRHQYVKGS